MGAPAQDVARVRGAARSTAVATIALHQIVVAVLVRHGCRRHRLRPPPPLPSSVMTAVTVDCAPCLSSIVSAASALVYHGYSRHDHRRRHPEEKR